MALARRKERADFRPAEDARLPPLEDALRRCQALAMLKGAAAPAVPALRKTLRHEDLWLRIKAADALAGIGEPAM